jgi:hypothetical protein
MNKLTLLVVAVSFTILAACGDDPAPIPNNNNQQPNAPAGSSSTNPPAGTPAQQQQETNGACSVQPLLDPGAFGIASGSFGINPKQTDNEVVVANFFQTDKQPPAFTVALNRTPEGDVPPIFRDGFKTGTFDLAKSTAPSEKADEPAKGCSTCIDVVTSSQLFRAISGTLEITRIDRPVDPNPGRMAGTVTNATLKRLHPVTRAVVQDGCETRVERWAFDLPLPKVIIGTEEGPGGQ